MGNAGPFTEVGGPVERLLVVACRRDHDINRPLRWLRLAGHGLLGDSRAALGLVLSIPEFALFEFRQHLAGKKSERGTLLVKR